MHRDTGTVLTAGYLGSFFCGESPGNPMSVRGRSVFNSDTPRIYKGTNMQFDVVMHKGREYYCLIRDKEKEIFYSICNFCPAHQTEENQK